jgi:hypothetical protein
MKSSRLSLTWSHYHPMSLLSCTVFRTDPRDTGAYPDPTVELSEVPRHTNRRRVVRQTPTDVRGRMPLNKSYCGMQFNSVNQDEHTRSSTLGIRFVGSWPSDICIRLAITRGDIDAPVNVSGLPSPVSRPL